jgi:hypothetical protein
MSDKIIDISEKLLEKRFANKATVRWFQRRLKAVQELFEDEPETYYEVMEEASRRCAERGIREEDDPWACLWELEAVAYERVYQGDEE